jgi:hypothetical protein
MPLTPITEEVHQFEGLMYESPGYMSRKTVTVAANAANPVLQPGTLLGKVTATGTWGVHDNTATDGRQTLAFNAAGILLTKVDSLTGQPGLIIYRDAAFNGHLLSYAAGMDATEQAAARTQLANLGEVNIQIRL